MSEQKIYLDCPYSEKDQVKKLGGLWDSEKRKWYITDDMDSQPFSKWLENSQQTLNQPQENNHVSENEGVKSYLNCPFDDKDECKALGGKWDSEEKKWYVPDNVDITPFKKWL